MTRPAKKPPAKAIPAANLLAQRPHTDLPADPNDPYYDDVGDEDGQFFDLPTTPEQDQDENESHLSEAREQYAELMEDAAQDEMNLTDFQRYWRRIKSHMARTLEARWHLGGPHVDTVQDVSTIVRGAQEVGGDLTQLYAARGLGVNFKPFALNDSILERPGVSKFEVYSRPLRERTMGAQLKRLGTLASTDLQLAKTRTLFSAFDEDQTVNRAPVRAYRRDTTSENPCALCEIAATQLYFTTDLMPIHDNCECDVIMADTDEIDEHEARYHHLGFVDRLLETGDQKKAIESLADADADLDEYVNLTKIEQHGELGPVIRWRGQKFTGPQDLPHPMGVRPVPTISGPGAGHEGRVAANLARVRQIRRQRGHGLHYAEGHGGLSTYLPPTPKVTRPIPRKLAPVIELRPPKPKVIDFEHDRITDVIEGMRAKYGGTVFTREWDSPAYNDGTKREMLRAFDEMMTKYPQVHVRTIDIKDSHGDYAGLTTYGKTQGAGADSIMIDADVMKRTPENLNEAWSHAFRDRFHFPSAGDASRYIVYHEFGHALDSAGNFETRSVANELLSKEYTKSGIWKPLDEPGLNNKQINDRALENQDEMRKWMGQQLSGYSMVDGYLPDQINPDTGKLGRMGLNKGEALAQAFSDVEMRGDKAGDVSKAFHKTMLENIGRERPAVPRVGAATPKSAADRLAEMTEPKPNWKPADLHKEDNFSRNKSGQVILSDEQRKLCEQLATRIWIDGAKVEPAISAAARTSVESQGGFMSGWDFRQKTGPSLYRKIQAEAIDRANGKPVTEDDIGRAAKDIKDSVRYTAVMPEDGFWDKGDNLRKALQQMGAKVIKDPVGIPISGYRGRNMAFTLNGTAFEMQVNTELGVAIKDEAHQIYNVSRKLKDSLKAKGLDPNDDPTYRKMLHDMQSKWDSMPMLKGTPVVQTEEDAKSGDINKVLYTMDHTSYLGPTVPGPFSINTVPLSAPEMVGRARVPSTAFGLDWVPDSPEAKIVAEARQVGDDVWDSLPIQHLSPGTHIKANEGTLKKKSIDKVVGGKEPFREGYVIKLFRTDDGLLHVVDGHTRIAMYNALGRDMPVRIIDEDMVQKALLHQGFGDLYGPDWLENLAAHSDFASAADQHAAFAAIRAARTPRPELPAVTGLSADQKGWGSVAKRLPDGTEIRPVYKKNQAGKKTLDVAATWAKVSDEKLRENWRLALRASRPWAQKAGADWYPGVNRLAKRLTAKYKDTFEKRWGVKLTPDLTAAFFAAYSENNGWDGNLVGVRRLLDGTGSEYAGALKDFNYDEARDYAGIKAGKYGIKYVVPVTDGSDSGFTIPGYEGRYKNYDFHVNKALRAMKNPRGGIADLRENDATAPKPADFGANIAGDYSRATADRWVARIILHTDDGDFAESMRGFTKTKNKVPNRIGYQRMSQALQEVAREPEFAHLNAAAVQAIPWVNVVGPLGSIGEIDDLTSYASVKAETLRKAAEFGDVD